MKIIQTISGRGVAVRGDDIDTDRIIPARFLRCVTFDGLGEHAFEDDRAALKGQHPFDRPQFAGARVLVANGNFGCGSSREHAPQSLLRWGIEGLVAESFAEIFFGNCVALGAPCFVLSPAEVKALQDAIEKDPKMEITLDVEGRRVSWVSGGARHEAAATVPDGAREAFLSGSWDSTQLLLDAADLVDAVAARLPYVK